MSFLCGAECVSLLGLLSLGVEVLHVRGLGRQCLVATGHLDEFEPVPRICRVILAVYEEDPGNPKFPPKGGYRMNPEWIIKHVTHEQTQGHAPPSEFRGCM